MAHSITSFQKRILAGFVFVILFYLPLQSIAQVTDQDSIKLQEKAIKVFLDVSGMYDEHIKREIPFVNYVRDRKQAQVHIMMTTQRTGSNGTEHSLFFIGQKNFTGQNDTLVYVSKKDDTEEIIRTQIIKVLKAGLMTHVAKTPLFKDMAISYHRKATPTDVIDKWNNWVFNLGSHGWFNGEEKYKSNSISGSFSADRVTPEWKWSMGINTSYDKDVYELDDTTKVEGKRKSHSFRGLGVKSINEHWSAGFFTSGRSSLYSNTKFSFEFAPAVEFNVFPYAESTRREFRFLYKISYTNVQYDEVTIYDKLREQLFSESLAATIEMKEKWGSINSTLTGSHYFHDFDKHNLSLSTSLNIRIFEGFSVNLFGNISFIHDRLRLQKGDLSTEDILLRQKELSTSYDYFASIGLSYQFGSIFSNVVNPRFGSSGGGRHIIIM